MQSNCAPYEVPEVPTGLSGLPALAEKSAEASLAYQSDNGGLLVLGRRAEE